LRRAEDRDISEEDRDMIQITPAATARIRQSASEAGVETPVLRVAAQEAADGSVEYGMGFDQSRPGDTTKEFEGVYVVVAARSLELLEGVVLDFAEIEPGDFRFVFARPGEDAGP
jgi:iron-sulfur cluster assembly protein